MRSMILLAAALLAGCASRQAETIDFEAMPLQSGRDEIQTKQIVFSKHQALSIDDAPFPGMSGRYLGIGPSSEPVLEMFIVEATRINKLRFSYNMPAESRYRYSCVDDRTDQKEYRFPQPSGRIEIDCSGHDGVFRVHVLGRFGQETKGGLDDVEIYR